MRQKIFRRPSPGTVLAFMALVVMAAPIALADNGGPHARAAKKKKASIPAHAKYADRAGNATKLGGYKVSFQAKPNTIPVVGPNGKLALSIQGAAGSGANGLQGPPGPQGVPGPAGPSGTAGGERFVFETGTNAQDPTVLATKQARCAPNERVSGGGYEMVRPPDKTDPHSIDEVSTSKPILNDDGTTGWIVQARNIPPAVNYVSTSTVSAGPVPQMVIFRVWAICTS